MGLKTPRNNFVFVPNRLPNLFARRLKMTRPLRQKSASLKGDTQSLLGIPSAILSFFDIDGGKVFLNWALPSWAALWLPSSLPVLTFVKAPQLCLIGTFQIRVHCMKCLKYSYSGVKGREILAGNFEHCIAPEWKTIIRVLIERINLTTSSHVNILRACVWSELVSVRTKFTKRLFTKCR